MAEGSRLVVLDARTGRTRFLRGTSEPSNAQWPSVLLAGDAVGAQEMAGDKAGRHAAGAGAGDEDVGVILADAALQIERFDGRGAAMRRVLIKSHVLVDLHQQRMQEAEGVVA